MSWAKIPNQPWDVIERMKQAWPFLISRCTLNQSMVASSLAGHTKWAELKTLVWIWLSSKTRDLLISFRVCRAFISRKGRRATPSWFAADPGLRESIGLNLSYI